MRRIDSIENQMRGTITYELDDGTRITLFQSAVEECGLGNLMRGLGYEHLLPTERIPVIWRGKEVGTMPPDFDPLTTKSKSFLYDLRSGDFVRNGDKWVASKMLGLGDLECVPGFIGTELPTPPESEVG